MITFDAGLVISAVTLGEGLAVLKSTPSDERAASASAPHRGDVWCMLCTVCLRGLSACHLWRGGKGASPRPASGFGRRFLVHPRARPWPTIGAPRRSRRLRRPRRLGLPLHPRGAAAPVAAFMRRHRWTQVAGDAGSACRVRVACTDSAGPLRMPTVWSLGRSAAHSVWSPFGLPAAAARVRPLGRPSGPEADPGGSGLAWGW